MLKFNLFLIWSIGLLATGSIVGWQAHQKVSELYQNPWSIVYSLGGKP
jgi:hypothetical protein